PRLHNLIQIDDGPVFDAERERSIHPHRLPTLQEVSSNKVRSRQILMAGDGNQGTAEAIRHVLDEARFSAAGRPLQHDRHAGRRRRLEQSDLPVHFNIERLFLEPILFTALLQPCCQSFLPLLVSMDYSDRRLANSSDTLRVNCRPRSPRLYLTHASAEPIHALSCLCADGAASRWMRGVADRPQGHG